MCTPDTRLNSCRDVVHFDFELRSNIVQAVHEHLKNFIFTYAVHSEYIQCELYTENFYTLSLQHLSLIAKYSYPWQMTCTFYERKYVVPSVCIFCEIIRVFIFPNANCIFNLHIKYLVYQIVSVLILFTWALRKIHSSSYNIYLELLISCYAICKSESQMRLLTKSNLMGIWKFDVNHDWCSLSGCIFLIKLLYNHVISS